MLLSDPTTGYYYGAPVVASDGFGGMYVACYLSRDSGDVFIQDPVLQHVAASGGIVPGWPVGGRRLCVLPQVQTVVALVSDGSGGVYAIWLDGRGVYTSPPRLVDLYALRVLADGTAAPGWPTDGLPIAATAFGEYFLDAIPDGVGGLYVGWEVENPVPGDPQDCYATRLLPDGTTAPGWPVGGMPVAPTGGYELGPLLAPDGAGGILALTARSLPPPDLRVRRIRGDGTVPPEWPAGDASLEMGPSWQGSRFLSDGAGGAYHVWMDDRTRPAGSSFGAQYLDIYAHHLLPDGTLDPRWPVGGLPICNLPAEQSRQRLVPDGAGGVVVVWEDLRDYATTGADVYAQRVRADGTLYPGWPAQGRAVSRAPVFHWNTRACEDGTGGAYVTTADMVNDRVWVQHVLGNGEIEPGWPADGQLVAQVETLRQEYPAIAWDGYFGAVVAWQEKRPSVSLREQVFAQHLGPLGPTATLVSLQSATAEPGLARLAWLVSGAPSLRATVERRSEESEWSALGTAIADGSGRIAYEDATVEPGTRYAYRLRYADGENDATTPETWLDIPARYELALAGLRPNPATRGDLAVAFTLPARAAGSLEVLDVVGRRVTSRDLSSLGAGRHTLRLDEGASFNAGVYWLRLEHSGRRLTMRGVVIP